MCDHSLALYALSDAASIAIGIGDRGGDHGLLRAGVMGLRDYLEKQVVVWSVSIMSCDTIWSPGWPRDSPPSTTILLALCHSLLFI